MKTLNLMSLTSTSSDHLPHIRNQAPHYNLDQKNIYPYTEMLIAFLTLPH